MKACYVILERVHCMVCAHRGFAVSALVPDLPLSCQLASQCGNNTLHHATHKGFLEAVKLLVEYGVDPEQMNQALHPLQPRRSTPYKEGFV